MGIKVHMQDTCITTRTPHVVRYAHTSTLFSANQQLPTCSPFLFCHLENVL